MKNFVSYKISIFVSLLWIASLSAMESDKLSKNNFLVSKDLKDLEQSIFLAKNGPPEQESSGWFSAASEKVSNWWYGADNNLMAKLKEGTLTPDTVAQNEKFQKDVEDAFYSAIKSKRTENLCGLLEILITLGLLSNNENQCNAIADFLNQELVATCQQKQFDKFEKTRDTMRVANISINTDSINKVLDETKTQDIKIFKDIIQNQQNAVTKILEQMIQDREQFLAPFLEAQKILCLQKDLEGKEEPTKIQAKKELGVYDDAKAFNMLFKATKAFSEKK